MLREETTRGRPDLLVTNDLHVHMPRCIDTLEALARGRARGALVVDTGDFLEGSPWFARFGGEPELGVLDRVYDVVCPGNHGFSALRSFVSDRCVVLNTNVMEGDRHAFTPAHIHTRPDGRRVGLIATLGEGAFAVIPARERRGLRCVEPAQAIVQAAHTLRGQVDHLVLLAHGGLERDARLIEAVPDATIILSGHCHSATHTRRAGHTHAIKAREHDGWLSVWLRAPSWTHHTPPAPPERRAARFTHDALTWLNDALDVWAQERTGDVLRWPDAYALHSASRDAFARHIADHLARRWPDHAVLLNTTCFRGVLMPGSFPRADLTRILPFRTALVSCVADPHAMVRCAPPELREALILRERVVREAPRTSARPILTTAYLCDQLSGLDTPRTQQRLLQDEVADMAVAHVTS